MCGISGIINKNGRAVEYHEIRSITDLIAHRGPDGQGLFFGSNFAFGHRRLAILDISSAGHQPMIYGDKYTITFNGEIYNYLELKTELQQYGYAFTSNTDTEVILAAYDKWGSYCVDKFNGMWAFALYDRIKELIFCSRDRFGIKPFYYTDTAEKFAFGSEIKQILACNTSHAVANLRVVRDFLVEGYHDHTNETFFEGVHSLRPGHNLIYHLKNNKMREARYYSLSISPGLPGLDEESATQLFLTDFKQSILYQLRSDVKVGVCLSGGLDSSSVAGLSAMIHNASSTGKMQAIHAKASEKEKDESCYAKEVATNSDIELSIIEPTAEDFIDSIDEVVYSQEEPFSTPSIFMQHFLFEKAKEIECKVMLDGQGCDEILLGYERYYSAHLRSMPLLLAIKECFLIEKNSRLSLRQLFFSFIYFSAAKVRVLYLKRKFRFLKDEHIKEFPNIEKLAECAQDIRKMQKNEIESFQLPHLLRYVDKNSMWHSIEARVPFLDHKLVETCYGISNGLKIKHGWSKYILRSAMNSIIPNNIIWRKTKLGFEAPTNSWINKVRGNMECVIDQSKIVGIMCREKLDFKKIDIATLWKLYSIAKWEIVYSVNTDHQIGLVPAISGDNKKIGKFPVPSATLV